jgi:hypothetical protein
VPDVGYLSALVAALGLWAGLVTWIVGRMLDGLRQDLHQRLDSFDEQLRTLEQDTLRLRAELPLQYVRKEDAIRSESVIHAKLDALYAKIESMMGRP